MAISAAAVVATVFMAAAAATAAALSHLDFFGIGFTDFEHFALEAHGVAGEGMVEVHFNMGIGNVEHGAHDAHAVGCHHGECGSLAHHFAVKLAVDVEHVFFKFGNIFVRAFAECLVGSCLYVEGFAIGLAFDVFFEGCDKAAGDAVDEAFGMLVVG